MAVLPLPLPQGRTSVPEAPQLQQHQLQQRRGRGHLQQERQDELFEDTSQDHKGSPSHVKTAEEVLLRYSQHKPPWMDDSRLPIIHDHHHHHHHQHHGSPTPPPQQEKGPQNSSPSFISHKDGELLQTLCNRGHLDQALDVLSRMHIPLSTTTYHSLLKACNNKAALTHAKRVQAHIAQHKADLTGFLGGYLVVTLARCGAIDDACHISAKLPDRTVFSWTALISAYVDSGRGREALQMYQCMREDGLEPNSFTYVSLFKACGSIPDLEQGKKLHADARSKGLASHICVGNTLVSMYGKCGRVAEAEDVFTALSVRDIVSWNAMLSAYVEQGKGEKALLLYRQMQGEGLTPNQLTFMMALQACGTLAEKEGLCVEGQSSKTMCLESGHALHADIRTKNFATNLVVGTALLSVYGKCGAVVEAEDVFQSLSQHDIVSWTAMLTAYVEQGQGEKALQLYIRMQEEGMSPNPLTFVIALQACAALAEKEEGVAVQERSIKVMSLEIGQALHTDVCVKGYAVDVLVGTALLNMYGKCGAILEAEDVFNALSERDMVSWNVMLSAYVEQGEGEKALCLCKQMEEECLALDDITLICILQACNATGSLELCREVHFNIVSAGCDQMSSITSTLIGAYGGCASMVDAEAVFDGLLEPDIVSWTACIVGHAGEGNYAESLHMFEKLKWAGKRPDDVTFTSVLSACCHSGLVANGLHYFESISRDYGILPELKHYGIMLDLLGRAGDFKRVENMLGRMQMHADLNIWLCLLSACRTHGNIKLAKQAFDHAVILQPKQSAAYVLMSNIYSEAGLYECALEVEKCRLREGAWKRSGQSWIEDEHEVHSFIINHEHSQRKHLGYALHQLIKEL